jgi:hypothetical protein
MLVETALVIPMLLVMVLGVVGLGTLTHAQMAVSAVAREAARTGAMADTARDAHDQGVQRGYEVGAGYHLSRPPLDVQVDNTHFQRCGSVSARATYTYDFKNAPLLSWAHFKLQSNHTEPIDGYRDQLAPNGAC